MPPREQLPEAEQERLVEAVTQHRIRRLEEQSDVDEAGPLLRETLRAEVEDWMPVLLSHLAAALSDQEGKLLVSSLRWATEFIARKKIAPPENLEEVDWLEYVAALDLLKDAALASTPDQDGDCERVDRCPTCLSRNPMFEAPEELDLRPYGLMIKAGAEHAGRFWLEEMRERGHDISAIPVVYFNIAGEECRVEVAL